MHSFRFGALIAAVFVSAACGSSGAGDDAAGVGGGGQGGEATGGQSPGGSAGRGGAGGENAAGGGMGGASGTAGAPRGAGGAGGVTPGAPITAPDSQWTWVDFPDAMCANGNATGIGVNLKAGASRALIFLEEGGACFDESSCWGSNPTAVNIASGYDGTSFASDLASKGPLARSIFDHTDVGNVFKDYSYIYLPYCTGDVFAGDRVQTYGGHPTSFVGRKNIDAFLRRLLPTFAGYDRVVLAGSSAGGFGAIINWGRVSDAFTPIRVDLIDDSGPPFPNNEIGLLKLWDSQWDLAGALPAACDACKTQFDEVFPFFAAKYPAARGAFLSYLNDNVIPVYFVQDPKVYPNELESFVKADIEPQTNTRDFIVNAKGHTILGSTKLEAGATPVKLAVWLTSMETDDAGWANERP